eukprot:CAMPEP_0118843600 /NCGR_PEP_ID=MMETSP1162-20130426/83083_1 /TAXON_ID=33656 /ORGANISM="Phaeocystis Sp, Strain CCMP2710" /LENGTH=47 /DNA_ID= /DNA_START= /DNA_END= /DNA_ORIENTATION=
MSSSPLPITTFTAASASPIVTFTPFFLRFFFLILAKKCDFSPRVAAA